MYLDLSYIYYFLCLEELLFKELLQVPQRGLVLDGHGFVSQFAPLRQISPLGNAFCCLEEMFLRIIFSRSVSGITARLTTKSNFPFSSSARAWRKVTFFSPMLLAISEATRTFFPMLSTRWKYTSGKRMARIPESLLPCRGP